MLSLFCRRTLFPLAIIASLFSAVVPTRSHAQSYPIDCAILLCLSGGWPSSVPCARARAEFIRRITPWPVEPPLQIWRCPMGASYEADEAGGFRTRLYDIFYHDLPAPLPQSTALQAQPMPAVLKMPVENLEQDASRTAIQDYALRLVQDRADIDISGPDFNFVRSIRVFDVRYARQRESGRDDDCNRSAVVRLGTYGTQGDFSWTRSGVGALPSAHAGLERWGETCPNIFHRSVFVDWRDYEGNYGHEQVNY